MTTDARTDTSISNTESMSLDPVHAARELLPLVRSHADVSEAQRHLAAPVARAFAGAGLYRIAAPEPIGCAADPATQIETLETIATVDGSAAWNLMVGIEAFGLIAPGFKGCAELLDDPQTVLCSSTAAVGRAVKVDGGYMVSGRWQFVSGCHNADLFCATVQMYADETLQTSLGTRYAVLPRTEWEIIDTWHTSGLRGSGSHDVEVAPVLVPDERMVAPLGGAKGEHRTSSPLLILPLGARLAYNKVGISWGLARSAIDSFVSLAEGKVPRFSSRSLQSRPRAARAVAEATVQFRSGRSLVLDLLQDMWQKVSAAEHVTTHERALFQLACSDSVRNCRLAVDTLCEAAGTTANQVGHPLERIHRDIAVVGQHLTVAAHHIEDAGRVILGLPAQEMMLAGGRD